MRALFMRGKFTAEDAHAAAMTLAAYTIGLIPFVLMRSVVATFLARGDTATPVKAALSAAGVNIAFKIAFLYFTALAQVGLALATSIGAWINFGLIVWFGLRAGFISFDAAFKRAVGKLVAAGLLLTVALVDRATAGAGDQRRLPPHIHNVVALIVLALIGALVYGAAIMGLLGKNWLAAFSVSPEWLRRALPVPPAPE